MCVTPLCLIFFRMCVFPLSGNLLHVSAKHVLCSTCAGESGGWIVLLGSHTLPLLLMALPHSLLPLRGCFSALLQVSAWRTGVGQIRSRWENRVGIYAWSPSAGVVHCMTACTLEQS